MPKPKKPPTYDTDVFVNCPFDSEYRPIFEAIIFAIHECGFEAKYATQTDNALHNRFDKIVKLIRECKFGIHDISRTESTKIGKARFPRFNMPLELGVFLGAGYFGEGHVRQKSCLILDKDQYRYRNFVSDLSGQDIRSHSGKPEMAIREVCAWLSRNSPGMIIPGGAAVNNRFATFMTDLPFLCAAAKKAIDEIEMADYSELLTAWRLTNPS